MNDARVEYIGRDLEAMDLAENYHEWIWDLMRPFVGKNIVEVGAGTGSFSKLILRSAPESLSLVEPSAMFEALREATSSVGEATTVRLFNTTFAEAAAAIASERRPDTVIYVNVLEHVENDEAELRTVYETLQNSGRICIFVPAMPVLFSRYDRHLGHYRRYKLGELTRKCERAGFSISFARWMDLPGTMPWFLKYKLMRSMNMEAWAVRLYDKMVVPVARRVEKLLHPPRGKNVVVVGEKK